MAYLFENKFDQAFNLKNIILKCISCYKRDIIEIFISFKIMVQRNKNVLII